MNLSNRTAIQSHVTRHLSAYLVLLAVAAAAVTTTVFPVYFRAEDANYLEWAKHNSPGAAFNSVSARLSGVFRPMQNLTWWALYHVAGINPFLYQFCATLLYGLAFLFFFKVAELLFGFRAAVLSLLAHAAVFYWLGYIIFWFSDLTYIVEIFFANAAILVLMKAVRGRPLLFAPGIALYLCAALSKEPSVVMVPAVVALFVAAEWQNIDTKGRRYASIAMGFMAAAGIAWLMLNPSLRSRQGAEMWSGAGQAIGFLVRRWRFYAGFLVSELGILIWVCSLYLLFFPAFERRHSTAKHAKVLAFAASAVVALMLRRAPAVALVALMASFIPPVVGRRKEAAAIAWFVLPVLGVMTIAFALRTYLVECAFGVAIIMGAALDDMLSGLLRLKLPPVLRGKKAAAACALIVVCAGTFVAGPRLAAKLEALRVVSAQRQNFRDALEFVRSLPADGEVDLVVLDYRDMGLDNEKDIIPLPDLEKARRQKTMESLHLRSFLGVAGMERVRVHQFEWLRSGKCTGKALLFVMSNFEGWYLGEKANLPLTGQVVFSQTRRGETARLLRVTLPANHEPVSGR